MGRFSGISSVSQQLDLEAGIQRLTVEGVLLGQNREEEGQELPTAIFMPGRCAENISVCGSTLTFSFFYLLNASRRVEALRAVLNVFSE